MLSFQGCQKALQDEKIVYENNFESNKLANTTGLILASFNNSMVAGFYNTGKFSINLETLPKHNYIKVSFDLFIHDFWDGNNTGNEQVATGPDIWSMKVDSAYSVYTSFSNTVCNEVFCLLQSYPNNYPFQNNPGAGSGNFNLPGLCSTGAKTSLYRIERLIRHSGGRVSITFEDFLKQSNVPDKLCDESWSLDNLKISVVNSD